MSRQELEDAASFRRYADVDGDGIPQRSWPGVHPKGGYFTRGSGHNESAQYTESEDDYQKLMERLQRKMADASRYLPAPVMREASKPTRLGVIAYGSSDWAVREALDVMAESGVHANYLRVRSFPFGDDVQAFMDNHDHVFIVEQNRDAQLKILMLAELDVHKSDMTSVLHFNGMPITAKVLVDALSAHVSREAAA